MSGSAGPRRQSGPRGAERAVSGFRQRQTAEHAEGDHRERAVQIAAWRCRASASLPRRTRSSNASCGVMNTSNIEMG